MTKRAVFRVAVFVIALSLLSVAYRLLSRTTFDTATWQAADEPSEFRHRREMMRDVNALFADRSIETKESAQRYLGKPQRLDDAKDRVWLYDLGGETSAAAPGAKSWLEVIFDSQEKVVSHRIKQEWDAVDR